MSDRRVRRGKGAAIPWIAAIGVSAALAAGCKNKGSSAGDDAVSKDDAAAEVARPTAEDAAPPAPRPVAEQGTPLFADGAAVEPPAVWAAGEGGTLLVATAADVGGKPGARIERRSAAAASGEPVLVTECAGADFAGALTVNAYLESAETLFVVCESPHTADSPGLSRGVRLVWRQGAVSQAGSFENEGPPAYDSMDFDEGEGE